MIKLKKLNHVRMLKYLVSRIFELGPAIVVLMLSMVVTLILWNVTNRRISDNVSQMFEGEVNQIVNDLNRRIVTYSHALNSLQGLFASSTRVERNEWNTYLRSSKISQEIDIEFISYIEVVSNEEKESFIEDFRNDQTLKIGGYPNLTIYPEGERDEYAVIKYIYPESNDIINLFGFDLNSDPVRKKVLEMARDSGEEQASDKISILPNYSTGFIISAPIYQKNVSTDNVFQRREAIEGFVQVVIEIEDLLKNVLGGTDYSGVAFVIYDDVRENENIRNLDDSRVFYSNDGGKYTRNILYNPRFDLIRTLDIGDKRWIIRFVEKPKYGESIISSIVLWTILFGGTSTSILIFLLIQKLIDKQIRKNILQVAALEALTNAVIIIDLLGRVAWVNSAFTKLTGYTSKEIVGESSFKVLSSGKQNDELYQNIWKTINSGKIWHGEITNKRKDGSIYTEEQLIAPVKNQWGDITGYIAIKQDITKRKVEGEKLKLKNTELEDAKKAMVNVLEDLDMSRMKSEELLVEITAKSRQLKKSEHTFKNLIESSPDAIFVIDLQGEVQIVNNQVLHLFGLKRKDTVLKKSFFEFVTKNDREKTKKALEKVVKKGKANNIEFISSRKDGSIFDASANASLLLDDRDKPESIIAIVRDITRQKELDKAKSEFVSLASHQLRTPLGITRWYLETIKDDDYIKKAPKSLLDQIEVLSASNQRVLQLVGDLLSVSRIDQNSKKERPQETNVVQTIEEIISELNVIAKKKNIKLQFISKVEKVSKVFVEPLLFHEVIDNLVQNAIEYSSRESQVIIELKTIDSNKIAISVTDSGIGITQEDKKKLLLSFSEHQMRCLKTPKGLD